MPETIFLTFAGLFFPVFSMFSHPRLSPFSLWDPAMNATFSSSVNDGVIERLLTMLEVKGPGTFVEIGALNEEIWSNFLLRITMGLMVRH